VGVSDLFLRLTIHKYGSVLSCEINQVWISGRELKGTGSCNVVGTETKITMAKVKKCDTASMQDQARKKIDRKRISEALLADRLGLNEPWIERWEKNGEWKEEFCAPDRMPDFIRKNHTKREVEDVARDIERLTAAGCQRQVVYFCLAQLSPDALWLRAGGERRPLLKTGRAPSDDEDYLLQNRERRLATREDLEAVANTAKTARKQIHLYQRELALIAESAGYPLPVGLTCRPELPVDALALLEDSLTWAAKLAAVYTAPFESTLLKSKGLLYLTLYIKMYANPKKLSGSKMSGLLRESAKPSGTRRAKRTLFADNPLTSLATGTNKRHRLVTSDIAL
jgi:hypothetical protein